MGSFLFLGSLLPSGVLGNVTFLGNFYWTLLFRSLMTPTSTCRWSHAWSKRAIAGRGDRRGWTAFRAPSGLRHRGCCSGEERPWTDSGSISSIWRQGEYTARELDVVEEAEEPSEEEPAALLVPAYAPPRHHCCCQCKSPLLSFFVCCCCCFFLFFISFPLESDLCWGSSDWRFHGHFENFYRKGILGPFFSVSFMLGHLIEDFMGILKFVTVKESWVFLGRISLRCRRLAVFCRSTPLDHPNPLIYVP